MKTLIFLLLFICPVLKSQNVISLSLQPTDLGLGLRYDCLFDNAGLYVSGSKGTYKWDGGYIKDHLKTSVGLVFPKLLNASLGLTYSMYGEREGEINPKALIPFSLDVGCGTYIKRVFVGLRMDFIKSEGTVDIGIRL
jgi:hypothetical protein